MADTRTLLQRQYDEVLQENVTLREQLAAANLREERLKRESQERADKIRELVPEYMKLWAPLDAVRVLAQERDQASAELAECKQQLQRAVKALRFADTPCVSLSFRLE